MTTRLLNIHPVLPSANIERDIHWYEIQTGFETVFADEMYAVLRREGIFIHLQWHSNTEDDPLLGGSVIKIFVDNIHPIFEEFVNRKTIIADKLQLNTPWKTNEFGFFDLNQNAIFIVANVK